MGLIAPKQLGVAPLIAAKQQGVGGGLIAPKQIEIVLVVVSVDKSLGNFSGGTTITIEVNDSAGCVSGTCCGVALTSFAIVDPTHVSGVTGAMVASAVPGDITVTNASGTGTLVGAFEAFAPTNIAGLAGWLRADLDYVGGTWTDQAPGGVLTCSQATAGLRPTTATAINGKPTLHATAADLQFLASAVALTLAAAHAFVVMKQVSQSGNRLWHFGSQAVDDWHCFVTDPIYDGFGSNARQAVGATPHNGPSLASAAGVIYQVAATATEWTNKINTVVDGTTAVNTVAWDAAGFLLFATSTGGIVPSAYQDGDIGEKVLYDHKLSAPDEARLAAYFLDYWAITI